jgi:tetratricopeptide (TPR) repeat protein
MIQHPATIASVLLLAISTVAASGADQTIWDQCQGIRDADASIVACSRILQAPGETNANRAIAYYVRAAVYRLKGDSDQAIADYTKAIESNSRYADAYVSRGIVYQAKGDKDRAIADYTKAIEIDPRELAGERRCSRRRAPAVEETGARCDGIVAIDRAVAERGSACWPADQPDRARL